MNLINTIKNNREDLQKYLRSILEHRNNGTSYDTNSDLNKIFYVNNKQTTYNIQPFESSYHELLKAIDEKLNQKTAQQPKNNGNLAIQIYKYSNYAFPQVTTNRDNQLKK